MFLDTLEKQNPALIQAALTLFNQGRLLPDTTVIDVDQLMDNARLIRQVADDYGIKLYAMTKQIGRNPLLAKLLIDECRFDGIVCVDFKEARILAAHGLPIAHVGHLVQPPVNILDTLISEVKPQFITVYSLEKARQIAAAAARARRTQSILLKFYHPRDELYVNQESGFAINTLRAVVEEIQAIGNLSIAGITHFPCFLYDSDSKRLCPTPNLTTLLEARQALQALGINCEQVNAPSATCVETVPLLAGHGCTHGEPGHALTGTVPSNADTGQEEKIAMLYLSEISHHYGQDSYCYGGGYYQRGELKHGLVFDNNSQERITIYNDNPASIDYHLRVAGHYPVGSPVIMAYRTQVFVTRSDVALVQGIHSGRPRVLGLFDALGNPIAQREAS